MKQSKLKIVFSTLLIAIAGCQSTPDRPADMEEGLDQAISETKTLNSPKPLTAVPNSVQQELMLQNMAQAKQGLLSEKRLEIAATSVAANDFFTAIVEGSSYSVAIHPDVSGSITLNLTDVTLTEAIDVIQDIYGYDIRVNGNVIQVYPAGIRTETFALNYLFLKRFGTSSTSINSGGVQKMILTVVVEVATTEIVVAETVIVAVIIVTKVIKMAKVIVALTFTLKMNQISGVN